MEYILKQEEKRRYKLFVFAIIITFFAIIFSSLFFGLKGFIFSAGLLFYILITPLVLGRYKMFLFLWIVIVPFAGIFEKQLTFHGINLLTFSITGLSFPFACLLFYKYCHVLIKKFKFIIPLIIFLIIALLNLLRSGSNVMSILQLFRFHFIEIFIISITYLFLQKNSKETILNWINIFAFSNAVFAIIQRLTGIGMVHIEGLARVQGLTGHPNACGFLINIFLPLAFYMYLTSNNKEKKSWGLSIIVNVIALFFTLSKTSLGIFGLIIFIFLMNLPKNIKSKFFIALCVCISLLIILDFGFGLNVAKDLFARLGNDSSLEWRLNVWNSLLGSMTFSSYLLGNGINSVTNYLIRMENPQGSHNGYVQFLFEYGILGLSYMYSYLTVFIMSYKKLLNKITDEQKYSLLVLISITSVILIETFFDQALVNRVVLYFAWVIITIFYFKIFSDKESEQTVY